jgi:predicted DCC family thiol-disulfide oxidoreductase YuxK
MERIILFDGVCNLCNQSVQFILKKDPEGVFKFASLQSESGQKLLKRLGLPYDLNSFVLIEGNKAFLKSSAALHVCVQLNGFWRFMGIFLVIPPFIRDYFYNILAKNRYKWFGKRESCMLPAPQWKSRFLD